MNKRIKVEGVLVKPVKAPAKAPVKRSRAPGRPVAVISKKTPKKRASLVNIRSSSSDEDFQFSAPPQKRNTNQSTKQSTKPRKTPRYSALPSSSYPKNIPRKKKLSIEKVYQVSDSSDDEVTVISSTTNPTDIETIHLCDTETSSEDIANMLNDIIEGSKKGEENYSRPSTSNVCSNAAVDVAAKTEFIDNLLDTNQDLLDETYLKSLRELNEQTDKLLASSWDLINTDSSHSNHEESVIYLCTDKDLTKTSIENNNLQAIEPVAMNLTEEQGQNIKAQCPICLEALGTGPVSATTCGHTFCTACIDGCVKSQKKCPTCRKRLTIKMVHPLFLF